MPVQDKTQPKLSAIDLHKVLEGTRERRIERGQGPFSNQRVRIDQPDFARDRGRVLRTSEFRRIGNRSLVRCQPGTPAGFRFRFLRMEGDVEQDWAYLVE